MAAFNSTFQTDLAKPSRVVPIPDTYTRGDNESHTITVLVYDSANPSCGLMAGSVSAAVARQDGNTIPLTTGTKGAATVPVKLADGSTAQATPCTVTLKQACFDCPGQVVVVIRLVSGEAITSIFVGSGKVNEGLTNSIIDPGDVITDITALIAAAEQAAEDAEEALAIATHMVRYDETQTMTSSERAIASHNVGAHKIAEVFDPTATYTQGRYVLYLGDLYRLDAASFGPGAFNYSTGGWTYINPTQEPISLAEHAYTDAQKAQARENIGAGSAEDVSDLQMTDLQLGGMISDVGHSLAAEYDWQAGTYAVGDYVMSGDKLYRCTTAIATPETWTPAHWTEVKLSGDLTDLRGAINKFSGLTPIEMEGAGGLYNGNYINTNVSVGSEVSLTPVGSNGFRYAIVPCTSGDTFLINATGGGAPRVWAFINASNILLSKDVTANHTVENLVLAAPDNSAYLILNDKSGSTSYTGVDRMSVAERDIDILDANLNDYTGGAYVKLPSNADLNDYTTPGNFVAESNASVAGMSHLPAGLNRQFKLTVRKSGLNSQASITQMIFPIQLIYYNDTLVYAFIRQGRTDGVTSAWDGIPLSRLVSADYNGLMRNWDKVKIDNIEKYRTFEKELYPNIESKVADLLMLEKTLCVFHDNYYRADNATEIGNNGSRTKKYLYSDMKPSSDESNNIQVGISNHKAVATNPYSVSGDTIRIKYKNVLTSMPYKVVMSFDGKGVVAISPVDTSNYLYVEATNNAFTIGGVGSFAMDSVSVTHNLGISTITVYVYYNTINVYVAGQLFAKVPVSVENMLVGILFKASEVNEIAYTSFNVFNSAENLNSYQDEGIEKALSFSDQIVNNSETADYSYGILLNTEITRNSNKSIRFEQRKEDSAIKYRSEITVKNPRGKSEDANYALQTKIFSYDLYLPSDYGNDTAGEILWQMHHTPDGVVADGLVPNIAFVTSNGQFALNVRSFDFKAQSSEEIVDRHTYILGDYECGKWYHILVFIREGYLQEHDPCIAIWIDGELVHYKREPNAYNTTNGSYLKMGVYKPSYVHAADTGTTKRVIYLDNVYCWM